jgi:uncharacterized protein
MRTKVAPLAEIKTGEAEGIFTAYVSIFNSVDLVGDRVVPGAFTKSLERWRASGDPLPIAFQHDWSRPDIGIVIDAREDERGLWIKGKLDVDEPFPRQIFKRLRRRSLREFSYSYDIIEARPKDGINELLELELHEVGPVWKGAHPETQLLTVKSMPLLEDAKATLAVSWPSKPTRLLDALEVLEELGQG